MLRSDPTRPPRSTPPLSLLPCQLRVLLLTTLALLALGAAGCHPAPSSGRIAAVPAVPAPARAAAASDDAFLEEVEAATFHYFWDLANPRNGLVPDRHPTPSFSSIAAVGFGLTAIPVGVERGYVSRGAARRRVLTTLRFFRDAPAGPDEHGTTGYRGFYYHFLDMESGARFKDVELSTIDTTLLLAGVLFCDSYFDGAAPEEAEIRRLAEDLYRRADWRWMLARPPLVSMGWVPEHGFHGYDWRGLNEAMILYVLALGSPTHPVDPAAWEAYTGTYQWREYYGQEHVNFAPLFGHHYSQIWIDFRGIQDAYMRGRGIDYFENSRRATYAQRGYAIDNPMHWKGYGADLWGLTACDGPVDATLSIDGRLHRFFTYAARGAAATEVRDDGTICPTAAGGSVPFAPEIAIPALRRMRQLYGDRLFGARGFVDAFNPTLDFKTPVQQGRIVPGVGWFDGDSLGIDQGPILLMIENHRSGLIWRVMRKNPYLVKGLERAGFRGGWLEGR
jgi:hypothetical protein